MDEWDGLIERALQKEQEEEERKHAHSNQLEDKEQAHLRTVNRAIFKANNGCLRAAKQIMMGSKQATPCEGTKNAIQAKLAPEDEWTRMNEEIEECKKLAWKVQPQSKRTILMRLETAKNGAEPGWARTRNSHLKALKYILEGLSFFMNWAQMWTMEKAFRAEAQIWLRANIVPLTREVGNPDGSKKTRL